MKKKRFFVALTKKRVLTLTVAVQIWTEIVVNYIADFAIRFWYRLSQKWIRKQKQECLPLLWEQIDLQG